jgi:hypothetical protein
MKLAVKNWRRPQNGELGLEWDVIHVKKGIFKTSTRPVCGMYSYNV